jgi:hypothetical protein
MHTAIRLLPAVAAAALLSQPSTASAHAVGPAFTLAVSHAGNFTVGVNGVYTIVVSNIGGTASSGELDVVDLLTGPDYLHPVFSLVSATGTGWKCTPVGDPSVDSLCSTPGSIPPGGSAPPITLTVLPNVGGTLANTARLPGELGDDLATTTDVTIVMAAVPTLPQWALIALTGCLALAGVVALRRRTT